MAAAVSERLTRGLAAMLRNPDVFHPSIDKRAETAVATPTGQALAALVEAAEAWHEVTLDETADDPFTFIDRFHDAASAWLAATEETA